MSIGAELLKAYTDLDALHNAVTLEYYRHQPTPKIIAIYERLMIRSARAIEAVREHQVDPKEGIRRCTQALYILKALRKRLLALPRVAWWEEPPAPRNEASSSEEQAPVEATLEASATDERGLVNDQP